MSRGSNPSHPAPPHRDGLPSADGLSVPQRILIWFGLAYAPGESPEPARPRNRRKDLVVTALLGLALTFLVWSDRGATVGIVSAVAFTALIGLETGQVAGADRLAPFVILPVGFTVVLSPSVALWIPLAIGLALACVIAGLAMRQRRGTHAA